MAYIDHSQFDLNKLVLGSFVTKQKPNARYLSSSIMYEYDCKDGTKVVEPLCIQAPDLYSPTGIVIKSTEKASIYTSFDVSKPEVAAFVSPTGFWQKLYDASTNHVWSAKDSLKLNLSRKSHMESIFNYPITFRRDQNGEIIPNKNPCKYFTLNTSKIHHTKFLVPMPGGMSKYKTLGWDMLHDVNMTFKPIITFTNIIFVGRTVFLQYNIKTAIVSSCSKNIARGAPGALVDLLGRALSENEVKTPLSLSGAGVSNDWMAPPPYCVSDHDVIEIIEPPSYFEVLPPPYSIGGSSPSYSGSSSLSSSSAGSSSGGSSSGGLPPPFGDESPPPFED
jgi:hypothetical protein